MHRVDRWWWERNSAPRSRLANPAKAKERQVYSPAPSVSITKKNPAEAGLRLGHLHFPRTVTRGTGLIVFRLSCTVTD